MVAGSSLPAHRGLGTAGSLCNFRLHFGRATILQNRIVAELGARRTHVKSPHSRNGSDKTYTNASASADNHEMSAGLPIVFLHYGRSAYLPFTMGRAKMLNLNSPVVLIGDKANQGFLPFVQHVNMNDYARQAVEFEKIYRHFSPNGRGYELFCFLRWFVLRDFMLAHRLQSIIHLDSDVILNVDVNVEQANWKNAGLSLINSVCAGNMFVNGTQTLEALCQLIWNMYDGPGAEARLEEMYAQIQRDSGGGICDMCALRELRRSRPTDVAEMTGVQPDDSYWDANIHLSEGFEMNGRCKAIRWIDGKPYGRHLASGRDIWFKSLHYQGAAKEFIEPTFRAAYPASAAAA